MSRLARWQTWVIVAAALAVLLAVEDLFLFERNRTLQVQVANRQAFLQRASQLEVLHRELVNAIATLAARNNDAALRAVLEQAPAPSAPSPGPSAPSPAPSVPAPAAGSGR
ncbi:MAG TPA: hypothetical protein VFX14_09010 [Methylomirabilota bacterium]|nr:hypothetical protein [Methylomirabilota bacterium]